MTAMIKPGALTSLLLTDSNATPTFNYKMRPEYNKIYKKDVTGWVGYDEKRTHFEEILITEIFECVEETDDQPKLIELGYMCPQGHVSQYYHGFLYRYHNDTKLIPIYDSNGWLAGIQAIIPANMKGFNSKNESIQLPPIETMPPVIPMFTNAGSPYFTITAYFKHPKLVCNPIAKVQAGKGLYIQTGKDPVINHKQIPMEAKDLDDNWKRADCLPSMGTHYFYNLTKNLACEQIYPVFLMYDNEGHLGAFGWTFQGEPLDGDISVVDWFKLTKETFYFAFDPTQLPSCMFTDGFQIFGLHIWLQPHNRSTMMICPTKTITKKPTVVDTSTRIYNPMVENGDPEMKGQSNQNNNIINADPGDSASVPKFNISLLCTIFILLRTLLQRFQFRIV
ncbi:hypothetical protein FSP39_006599 [Pinctada imbricata]|uniref:Uncharacterized protein n=1 Tax=Pinctada imbricata TaxID=66713 RepID=A0AA89C0X8_PINIB|nr:hypothetical protein FSP39_006599 [Pinctada imbricata]